MTFEIMRTRMANRAFTLIEVLVTVALTGLIAALAFAPVAYVVRQITETEATYSDETAMRRAAMFMAQDVSACLRLADTAIRLVAHKELGGADDDTLIVAGSAHAKQNLAAGSVVYRVVRRSFINERQVPGLYRWILPGVLPEDVVHDRLEAKDGQLIIPYVTEMSLSVYDPPEWLSDYSGKLPAGMKFVLSRGDKTEEGESVEYVFSLPK